MTENIITDKAQLSKEQLYELILPQIRSLVEGETELIANLANVAAALKQSLDFFWVGFYLVKNNELVLGPFQGTVACTRIAYGRGVCGTAWKEKKILLVPDIDDFEGHIACSALSRSEIVLPAFNKQGEVFLVLDVDSDRINDFDETDKINLRKVVEVIEKKLASD